MTTTAYLAHGDARDCLPDLPAGSVRLWLGSVPYLDLIDYTRAAAMLADGRERPVWRQHQESLGDYLAVHGMVVERMVPALADDALVALEVDAVRAAGTLVPLPDYWGQLLEAHGLRVVERITLVRRLALGHRSGHFKRYPLEPGQGNPGYALLDNVTSTVLVAAKGDPMRRLRREARARDAVPMAWAEAYLRTAWGLTPPRRRTADRRAGHPVPMDRTVLQALIRLYSLTGDVVADCYAGEGTAGVVAVQEGRVPVLVEREAAFVNRAQQLLRAAGCQVEPLRALPQPRGRVLAPSAQLALPLDPVVAAVARRAFLQAGVDDVTDRHREIARQMAREFGIGVTPDLVGLFLRAERRYYRDTKAA